MNQQRFAALVLELVEENPFACRAVLKILETQFTEEVATLAVTCEARPRLLVNLRFIKAHCRTDAEVKAVIMHEFLHVLLRHTDQIRGHLTRARHIALDAVINSIIHRTMGPDYSAMMSRFYAKARGAMKLLRPIEDWDYPSPITRLIAKRGGRQLDDLPPEIMSVWQGLYCGLLVADDIEDIALSLEPQDQALASEALGDALLGNHDQAGQLPEDLQQAFNRVLREMNGSGIWRGQFAGLGGPIAELARTAGDPVPKWKRDLMPVLRQHLSPDRHRINMETIASEQTLPALSTRDRRAFMRSWWNPILPSATWETTQLRPAGKAQVYLDVSGSMNAEMPHLIGLLASLSDKIKRPFWAFSTEVTPARINKGRLLTETTGGTSLACVLEHIVATKPPAALIVTDGYVETVEPGLWLRASRGRRLTAIVSANGSTSELTEIGVPVVQLAPLPGHQAG